MNLGVTIPQSSGSDAALAGRPARRASVLIIVLWISFGLVSLALYFANSMNFEMRASDNRVSGLATEEAIEGGIRYFTYVLNTLISYGSNGYVPRPFWDYQCQAVPVGESHFWVVGRDTNNAVGPGHMAFGLIPENARLNLNTASSNTLYWLPRMTDDLIMSLIDWRDTNGTGPTVSYYGSMTPPYVCKCDHFETVDEIRLLLGSTMDVCVGEDINRNGILDPNENDDNSDGMLTPGLVECVTAYSQEPIPPATNSDGSVNIVINISSMTPPAANLRSLLLTNNIDSTRVTEILRNLGLSTTTTGGGARGGGAAGGTTTTAVTFRSPLDFYIKSQMTAEEFALIATNLAMKTSGFVQGRVNVNWASAGPFRSPRRG
jgi:hypothetical protein